MQSQARDTTTSDPDTDISTLSDESENLKINHEAQMKKLEATLKDRDTEIASKDAIIASKDTVIANKDTTISRLEEKLRNQTIANDSLNTSSISQAKIRADLHDFSVININATLNGMKKEE
mgnify:CR=1 FL=1